MAVLLAHHVAATLGVRCLEKKEFLLDDDRTHRNQYSGMAIDLGADSWQSMRKINMQIELSPA